MTTDVLTEARTMDALAAAQTMREQGHPALDVLRFLVVVEEVMADLRGAA